MAKAPMPVVPADDEELRFAKKQQWYVATAAVTLSAAVFALADKLDDITDYEKRIAVLAVATIAVCAFLNLRSLQKHIVSKRPENDQVPWWMSRGVEVMWTLVGAVVLSSIAVGYAIMW